MAKGRGQFRDKIRPLATRIETEETNSTVADIIKSMQYNSVLPANPASSLL